MFIQWKIWGLVRQARKLGRDAAVQDRVIAEFVKIGSSAVGPLTRASTNDLNHVRLVAVKALGRIGDPTARESLRQVLRTGSLVSTDVRVAAAEALSQFTDAETIAALVGALGDSAPDVRKSVMGALVRIGAPARPFLTGPKIASGAADAGLSIGLVLAELGDFEAALALLERVDAVARGQLIYAVAQKGRAAVPHLIRHFRSAADPWDRASIVSGLGRTGDPECLPILSNALKDPHDKIRESAIRALGELGDPAAVPDLAECFRDPRFRSWDVARSLGKIKSQAAVDALVAGLATHPEETCKVLEEIGWRPESAEHRALVAVAKDRYDDAIREGSASVPVLIGALSHLSKRARALQSLAQLGGIAIDGVIRALFVAGGNVNEGAAEALVRIGDERAVEPLIQLLPRLQAIEALERIGDPKAAAPLVNVLLNGPDEQQRTAAAKALKGLGWAPSAAAERVSFAIGEKRWIDVAAEGEIAVAQVCKLCGLDDLIYVLPMIGGDESARELAHLLDSSRIGFDQRRAVIFALEKAGGQVATERLVRELYRGPHARPHEAAESLQRMGWEPSTSEHRALLAVAIGQLGDAVKEGASAIGPLIKYAQESGHTGRDVVAALLNLGRDGTDALQSLLLHAESEGARYKIASQLCSEVFSHTVDPVLKQLAQQERDRIERSREATRSAAQAAQQQMANCQHEWYSDYSGPPGSPIYHRCRKCGREDLD